MLVARKLLQGAVHHEGKARLRIHFGTLHKEVVSNIPQPADELPKLLGIGDAVVQLVVHCAMPERRRVLVDDGDGVVVGGSCDAMRTVQVYHFDVRQARPFGGQILRVHILHVDKSGTPQTCDAFTACDIAIHKELGPQGAKPHNRPWLSCVGHAHLLKMAGRNDDTLPWIEFLHDLRLERHHLLHLAAADGNTTTQEAVIVSGLGFAVLNLQYTRSGRRRNAPSSAGATPMPSPAQLRAVARLQ